MKIHVYIKQSLALTKRIYTMKFLIVIAVLLIGWKMGPSAIKALKRTWVKQHKLYKSLDEYVKTATKDRPESHGYVHMKAVAERVVEWFDEYPRDILLDMAILAWIHDVRDHKYDDVPEADFQVKMRELGIKQEILMLVPFISFTAEKRNGNKYWESKTTERQQLIRNAVSDVDKSLALGTIGVVRCLQYIREKNPGIGSPELVKKLQDHWDDKLGLLYSEYVYTPIGGHKTCSMHSETFKFISYLAENPSAAYFYV